jgi:DNA-binding LacI/PurR family transcriptional regulator
MYEQGATMARVLVSHLRGGAPERLTILPTELVVRESA